MSIQAQQQLITSRGLKDTNLQHRKNKTKLKLDTSRYWRVSDKKLSQHYAINNKRLDKSKNMTEHKPEQ